MVSEYFAFSKKAVAVAESTLKSFENVKVAGKRCDYVVFAFNDPKTEIVPESQFPASEEDCQAHDSDVKERTREVNFAKRVWPRLVEHLTKFKEKPRFAVASFHYMAGERPSDKLVYICWCPDRCSVKDRFVTGWSSQALVAALGVSCQIQACNDDELDYAAVLAKVTRI